ncbi:hypothetical protein [Desulfarculus baarsii]
MSSITHGNWRGEAELALKSANQDRLDNALEDVRPQWRETAYDDAEERLLGEVGDIVDEIEAMAAHYANIRANPAFEPWAGDGGLLWNLLDAATEEIERRRAQGKEPPRVIAGQGMDLIKLARPSWAA